MGYQALLVQPPGWIMDLYSNSLSRRANLSWEGKTFTVLQSGGWMSGDDLARACMGALSRH